MLLADGLTRNELNRNRRKNLGCLKSTSTMLSVRKRIIRRRRLYGSRANKYTPEELLLMKTQDIGYIFQKVQSEKKKTEKLTATLHSLDNWPSSRYVYFAEDRKEAREIQSCPKSGKMPVSEDIPDRIKRKTAGSDRELEGRRKRVNELEKIYMDMAMQKELQKKR
ncbi:probable U3 small nucleolar RNA-associated protein 11 [Malus sylvestris]|uniref:probable U3 small nucleolar RNA-associated protein 11 n=1 Tax=Malus sylvestris TaxID=3752 RepID=UPI0021ACA075|nr:probable U3 small nucleolar RNA-associated protein 11 [Malus sylvestris]